MAARLLRLVLLVPFLALAVSAQEVEEEVHWEVGNYAGRRVGWVVNFWETTSNHRVSVEVSTDGTNFGPPGPGEMEDSVSENANFSPPGSTVGPGGIVGVIITPVERSSQAATYAMIGLAALLGLGIGYAIGRRRS